MKNYFNEVEDLEYAFSDLIYGGRDFLGFWDNSDIEIKGYEIHDYVYAITLDSEMFAVYDSMHSHLWMNYEYYPGETAMAVEYALVSFLMCFAKSGVTVNALTPQTDIPIYVNANKSMPLGV